MATAMLELRIGLAPQRTATNAPTANTGTSTGSAIGRCTTAGCNGVGISDASDAAVRNDCCDVRRERLTSA